MSSNQSDRFPDRLDIIAAPGSVAGTGGGLRPATKSRRKLQVRRSPPTIPASSRTLATFGRRP